ncbi:L,D-transpeptidase family protein [Paenibacillus thalictri]|uniref:Tetratricopeptide repeat protein n=1 Tax=Paenibacillus thalictri TaxID=2527873 RepID=A0A4Q9DY84_9BACL|nr:L,D-transpeptidase family protein [Paenibacillus thalictri]TBL80808.1 tetratricopeptide repeat protein [Paenibacillus thalictri]
MNPIKKRFKSHLVDGLEHLQKNLHINRNDPMYYEKVIRYMDPKSTEAHYRLGQKYEQRGNMDKALFHYNECMKTYPSPYYYDSASAIRKLGRKNSPKAVSEPPVFHKGGASLTPFWKIVLVSLLLLNLMLLGLYLAKGTVSKTVSALKLWGIGREITFESVDVPFIMYLSNNKPQKDIEYDIYNKALELAKANLGQNVQIYGIAYNGPNPEQNTVPMADQTWKTKAFVVAEYNAAHDQNVKIRYLQADFQRLKPLTEAGANLVRTALEAYISDNGAPPDTLDKLAADYPHNYLSFIPKEIQSGSNQIVKKYDGLGGWVFDSSTKQISDMFYPNVTGPPNSQMADFEPFRLVVGKSDHMLQLLSGSTLLAEKQVGLGADDLTPEGVFTVVDRVKEPRGKQPNVYGSAALGMGSLAVHGTNAPDSIGKNLSLGCIRMTNEDMEELYPFVPKGTQVFIGDRIQTQPNAASALWNPEGLSPSETSRAVETAKNAIFHWLG